MPSAEVLALTGTDAALGLDRAECQARLHRHGANSLPEPPPHPLWRRFARQFWSPLIGMLFTGSLLIEVIFSLDGLGLLGYQAILDRDYPVVFGTLYIFSLVGLVLNLVSDLAYHVVDPRIDFEARAS